jgi:hypothetical protein
VTDEKIILWLLAQDAKWRQLIKMAAQSGSSAGAGAKNIRLNRIAVARLNMIAETLKFITDDE